MKSSNPPSPRPLPIKKKMRGRGGGGIFKTYVRPYSRMPIPSMIQPPQLPNIHPRYHTTVQSSLSGTFLETLPQLVSTPLKRPSLSPRICPPTLSRDPALFCQYLRKLYSNFFADESGWKEGVRLPEETYPNDCMMSTTLRKLLKEGVERIRAFPSAWIPS